MSRKISVYVDEDLHRALKAAASLQGLSLSEFMVGAAKRALHAPSRQEAMARMDVVRDSVRDRFSPESIREMREEGRRTWPKV